MPADPEVTIAIRDMASDLIERIDSKLDDHQRRSDETTQRIYDRMEEHARESRALQERKAAETQGAVNTLSTQVTTVTAELHAHITHDDEVQARHEAAIQAAIEDRHKVWKALARMSGAGALGAAITKYLEGGGS